MNTAAAQPRAEPVKAEQLALSEKAGEGTIIAALRRARTLRQQQT